MKNLLILIMMCCFVLICVSCQNYDVKFDVFEENPSLIGLADGSNINEIRSDGDELKIYKNYNQLVNDLNSKGFIINDDTFLKKYCDDFFDNKSLVLYYSIDPRGGLKYTFQSISVIDSELFLNIKINKKNEGVTVETPRLFIIEIDKNDVNSFDKLKCKIK
jgi:hypothetical protein